MRTRGRFLGLVGVLAAVHAAVALYVALPPVGVVLMEATHVAAQLCHHEFLAHYRSVAAPVATGVVAVVLIGTARFAHACWAMAARTRAAVLPLLLAGLGASPARVRDLAVRSRLERRVAVVEAEDAFAFCHGLRQPRIYISTGLCALLQDDELIAVLHHEDHHRRRREPLRLLLLGALVRTFSFWPSLPALFADARTEMEVAADAHAVLRSGSTRALARAMLKLLLRPSPPFHQIDTALAFAPLDPTEARIECLGAASTLPFPPLSWAHLWGPGLALAPVVCGLLILAANRDLHPLLSTCQLS